MSVSLELHFAASTKKGRPNRGTEKASELVGVSCYLIDSELLILVALEGGAALMVQEPAGA